MQRCRVKVKMTHEKKQLERNYYSITFRMWLENTCRDTGALQTMTGTPVIPTTHFKPYDARPVAVEQKPSSPRIIQ